MSEGKDKERQKGCMKRRTTIEQSSQDSSPSHDHEILDDCSAVTTTILLFTWQDES